LDHPLAFNQHDEISISISYFHCAELNIELIEWDVDDATHDERLHRSEQYFTESQSRCHFLRHSNNRPHRSHFLGAKPFLV
jgi:hypothetical protein